MKRATQKTATRRLVIEKATRLCRKHGFLRTRTVDVAQAAGLSHGAIFVHFSTRGLLFEEVAATMGRKITDRLYELAASGADFGACLRAQLECLEEEEDLYRHLVIENALLEFDARTMWTGILSAISNHLSGALERAMTAGIIRRAPLHLVFNTWIGLVHHYLIHKELFVSRGSVLRKHGPELVEFFISLLSKGNLKYGK
jgi:AcrR family transcriptional regulator